MEQSADINIFDILIWSGAFMSLLGMCGLIWCIIFVARARRAKLSDEDMRDKLKKALPLNLGSLLVSVLGLMLVMVGIFLA